MEIGTIEALGALGGIAGVVVAVIAVYKRPKTLDATLQEYAKEEDVNALRIEAKADLKTCQCSMISRCLERHKIVSESLKELYGLDRDRTKELTTSIKDLNKNLSDWQQGITKDIGNHDGRIKSLEHK